MSSLDLLFGEALHGLSCLVLVPISFLVATPIILLGACFHEGGYGPGVRYGYRQVGEFWANPRRFS